MPKICLIDASGYLFRAYHALPPLTTSKGQQVNAVYGFARMISKALSAENPDYVAVCFDTPEKTFRHEEYEDYKANRDEPDEAIIEQIPIAEDLIRAWGFKVMKAEGFEADDVIATIARQSEKKGWDVLILSGDKDILQLVSDKIKVRDDLYKKEYNREKVIDRYGVGPEKLVDLMSLIGDAVDNVKGVPGVGPKTAAVLIQENGDLENLFKDLKGAKPAVKAKLPEYKDHIINNRRLIRLREDVPLTEKLTDLVHKTPDPSIIGKFLNDLEFRGEFYGVNGGAVEETTLAPNKKRKTHTILDSKGLGLFKKHLKDAPRIAYDLETTSLNPRLAKIVGVALSTKEGEAWYIPVGHQYIGVPAQLPWDEVRTFLKEILEDERTVKCGQNLKFDNAILAQEGVFPKGPVFDTMIAMYCLEPQRSGFGLKTLAADFLSEKMTQFEELLGKEKDKTMAHVPIEESASYAGADAEVVIRLMDLFEPRLKKEGVLDLFDQYEIPLVPVLQEMEATGIALDVQYLDDIGRRFETEKGKIEAEIFKMAGGPFKLNSPKQLSQILFEKLKLPVIKKTKTGYSTNEEVLTKLADQHPICQKILSFRELSKLTSTYVVSLKELVDPVTNRIHTSFHQTGAATGRLSSTDPNLQNIPIRTEQGREIRKAFVPSKGHVFISADYSQIDLRALAHMSEDPVLLKTFKEGGDIHARTAAEVFHIKMDDVTSDMRRRAKAINFGIVYGQQAWGLSQNLNIEVKEAQEFIGKYFERYAGVKKWIENTLDDARKHGFVRTFSGRKRGLPDILSKNNSIRGFAERIAINTPLQGTSADIIKMAMIHLSKEIREKNLKTKMLVQIHDDLLFDVPENEVDTVIPMIREEMEKAVQLKVPLKVDIKKGSNWTDMEVV